MLKFAMLFLSFTGKKKKATNKNILESQIKLLKLKRVR